MHSASPLAPDALGRAQGVSASGLLAAEGGKLDDVLDLGPYTNCSTPSVAEDFSLERAYMLFQSLGLRHLVVVDSANRVKGMVTRKVCAPCSRLACCVCSGSCGVSGAACAQDLLGYRLDHAVQKFRAAGAGSPA